MCTPTSALTTHQATDKRGQALEDSYEWLAFSSDAAEELTWLNAQATAAQAAVVAETLEATTAQLAKHEEFTSDVTEHSERVEDILAVGARLIAAKNAHAEEVAALSADVKGKVAQLDEFSKTHRTKYGPGLGSETGGRVERRAGGGFGDGRAGWGKGGRVGGRVRGWVILTSSDLLAGGQSQARERDPRARV